MAHYHIINTGGTIGMIEGDTGLQPQPGLLKHQIEKNPALASWRDHQLSWYDWQPLVDSSAIQPEHWLQLQQQIQASEADGFLVIHGTDTLAYTASALSFLLAGHNKSVVITGSMVPLCTFNSDGIANLNTALEALALKRPEVCVVFAGDMLPGTRITKIHSHQSQAFKALNWHPSLWSQIPPAVPYPISHWQTPNIQLVTLFPGLSLDDFIHALNPECRALVINAYGSGNLANTTAFQTLLQKAIRLSVPIFVRSQCLYGHVQLGQYAASQPLTENTIACADMTLEAVLTKLQILANLYPHSEDLVPAFIKPWAREWQQLESIA